LNLVKVIIVSSKKLTFILNPNAAMGGADKKWPRIAALAKGRFGSFRALRTAGPGDAGRLTRQALLDGTQIVICIGGDGTLNEVVNGFMGENGPIRRDALLGFIPIGTGCDFIKTVPVPRDVTRVFDLIADSQFRDIDLGLLRFRDHRGRSAYRYFHNVTSFGLGGEVDARVNRTTKAFGGFFSFIWATLISLLVYDKKRVLLKVDDTFEQEVTTWNMVVANGQYHGGGMWVAPDAAIDDGLFHITVIGDLSLPQVFLNLPRLYNGKILDVPKVFTLTGRIIKARSDQQVLLDVDGEQPGQLPVNIQILPRVLHLIAQR
jgi:diacylglycerol kinase (ATP)